MLAPEIKKLDNLAKIQLIEEIWQSIDEYTEPPTWHQEVLQQRLKKIQNKKVKFVNINYL